MTGPNRASKALQSIVDTVEGVQNQTRSETASKLFEQEPLYDPPEAQTNTEMPSDEMDLQGVNGDHNLDLIERQIQSKDGERLLIAAKLVNVFNHAIQVQGDRVEWTASDYAKFIIAMRSIDGIGVETITKLREQL